MSLDRPRFRRDLEATPVEVDGQGYVDVRDPTTGGSFRFYDFEYRVALAFDGLAFDQMIPWLRWVAGIECQAAELREFATRLHDMGFLESSPTGVAVAPGPTPRERPAPEPAADEARPPSDEAADSPVDAAPDAPTLAEVERLPALPADKTPPSPDERVAASSPRVGRVTDAAEAEPPATAPASAPAVAADEAAGAAPAACEEPSRPTATGREAALAPVWSSAEDAAPPAPAAAEPGAAETFDGYAPAGAEEFASQTVATRDGFAAVADELATEERPPARLATWMAAVGTDEETVAVAPVPTPEEMAAPPVVAAVTEIAELPTPAEPVGAAPAALSEDAAPAAPEEVPAAASAAAEAPASTEVAAAPPAEEAAAPAGEMAVLDGGAAGEAATVSPEQATEAGFFAATGEGAAPAGATDAAAWSPAQESPLVPGLPLDPEVAFPPEVPRPAHLSTPRPEARCLDSSTFPVLPTPPPQPVPALPPRSHTPPVRPVPPAYLTPPPSTLGPLRTAQDAAERRHQRRALLLFGSLGVLAAVALIAVAGPFLFPGRRAPHVEVRTVTATPGTVLRYYGGGGLVSTMPGAVLKFPAGGTVTRIAKTGSVVAMGDVLAAVEAARPLLGQLARQRERLAFYQQIAETMHQVGNTVEEEKNAANVELRQAKIAKTLRALAQVAVVAGTAGEVEETYIREGETVEAGGLALKMRSPGHRATFELSRSEAAEARRLGFCQASVDGYVLTCKQAQDPGDETHLSVDIQALPLQLVGRPARLARARYVGAVALPASAVQSAGRRHHVLVVSSFGRLEARPVTVAEQNSAEAIVVQGLDSGEPVVIEPTPDLRPGMPAKVRSN